MLLQNAKLPFTHFARSFASPPSGADLLEVYNQLYSAANEAVNHFVATNAGSLSLHSTGGGDSPFSYNLAMTTHGMAILPRRAEGAMLRRDDGSEIGFVALNGTTLGGTMMVKHQEEWDTLRKGPELLDDILASIGIPRENTSYRSRV
jgi:ATP adenylyltransferase